MKYVKQTTFGWPNGNCYAACIASLLEVPIESCPVVLPDQDWNMIWDAWFEKRGIARVTLNARDGWRPKGYYIACGPSPREIDDNNGNRANHAVVAFWNEIIHDPHPDNTFLLEMTEIDILYPLNPAILCQAKI